MARRPKIMRAPEAEPDENRQRALNTALEQVVRWMISSSYEVQSFMATLQYPDGSYRKKLIDEGQELVFERAYAGKSGKPIFCFRPFDSQPWERLELIPADLDCHIPKFKVDLEAKSSISAASTAALVTRLVKNILTDEAKESELAAKAAAIDVRDTYKNHPLFGRF